MFATPITNYADELELPEAAGWNALPDDLDDLGTSQATSRNASDDASSGERAASISGEHAASIDPDDGTVPSTTGAAASLSARRDASASHAADGSSTSDGKASSRSSARSHNDAASSGAARSKQGASTEGASEAASTSAPASDVSSAGSAAQARTYRDGTYYASSTGKFGQVPVTVVIKDGEISRIDVGANQEAAAMLERASSQVISEILASQSTDVDTVTGATMTSEAIIDAVSQALERASS